MGKIGLNQPHMVAQIASQDTMNASTRFKVEPMHAMTTVPQPLPWAACHAQG